jgi:hypothetical protein
MVATDHVVSTEILALHASIAILVHRVMAMTDHVVSTEILALHVLIATRVHPVTVMIVLAVLIATLVHRVMVAMIVLVASIVILVHRVTVMIAHAVLTAMIVLVVSIVMIAHVALIATTAHRAPQRKNVQTKCVVALANAVRPEKCQQRQSVHVKSGLTKGQCVRNVIQTWVAFAQKAQAVRKKADEKKCVHSTPLWNSLSVH